MSYLHCPTCQHAYNVAAYSACPFCPVTATLVDPSADIVMAAEQLARAIARAKPAERDAALARMDHLALPAPGAPTAAATSDATLRQIRTILLPPPPPPAPPKPLLVQVALAVLTRIEARPRLRRPTELIRARV